MGTLGLGHSNIKLSRRRSYNLSSLVMDMRKFRGESHVAQQSRRDKLRVQQHLDEGVFPSSLEQGTSSVIHLGLNSDLVQVGNSNLQYNDQTLNIPSGIIQRDHVMLHPSAEEESSFPGMSSHSVLSKFNASQHSSSDNWMVGYGYGYANASASGLGGGRESSNNQNSMFVGVGDQLVLSNNARESNNVSSASQYLVKPNYSAYQQDHVRSSTLSNPASHEIYHNALHDVVTTASVGRGGSWMDYSGNQANSLQQFDNNAWMNRPLVEHCQQWGTGGDQLGFLASKSSQETTITTTTHQGLSLSLSSNPTTKIFGFNEDDQYDFQSSKPDGHHLCSMQKLSVTSKGSSGKSLQDTAGGTSSTPHLHRHTGPLGPFTGYATILKNSRFLKPAQDLLVDFCHMNDSKLVKGCDMTSERGISCREVSGSEASADAAAINAVDMEAEANKGNNSVGSSSTFYSSNEIRVDVGVGSSSSVDPCRPEYQQKKAKLLYLQEEVCRRYKLYHQQMQMVVSSFESVAGLSAATPYISLAFKTVARNFRCLRNAIADQIRQISRALGEDLLSPATGTSSSKGDINMSRLKYVGQKSGGVNMGFLEPQQHGWRPQRGLPERSVAILRAWLFEHFLHPYPTDTDKHMLATQTGLSRNQVSNWFINARVRVWKPMVEEIHMLESKGLAEGNQNLSLRDGKSTCEGSTSRPSEDQSINRSCINAMSDKQLACSDMLVPAGITGDAHDTEHWSHDKRSRMDFHIPTSMETSLMGFAPYQQGRLEMGGLGAVSLTLGLRHGVESAAQQHQQQYQRQEDQLRRQYGGHMIHDFAG